VLSSSPLLSFPKKEKEFILNTDASNIGISAVLFQKQEGEEKTGASCLTTLILTTVPIDYVEIDHVEIDHVNIDHVVINHDPD